MEPSVDEIMETIGEFTLEDAHDNLKELREECQREIEDLAEQTANNEAAPRLESFSAEEIEKMQHELIQSYLECAEQCDPRALPHTKTTDLRIKLGNDVDRLVEDMQAIKTRVQKDTERIEKNIAYLKSKKAGLEKMKKACEEQLAAETMEGDDAHQKEMACAKSLFKKARGDLRKCVEAIFPGEEDFELVLAELTQAYMKGGDDMYINVDPECLEFVNFLIAADVAEYHPHDKNRIRMMDMV